MNLLQKESPLGPDLVSFTLSVSVYFGHVDPMQWTPYMDDCVVALLQSQESPYDEMFVHQVKLQRIVGEVENVREASTASPDFYLKFLQQKVDEVKVKMPVQLQQNRTFQSLGLISIQMTILLLPFPNPQSMTLSFMRPNTHPTPPRLCSQLTHPAKAFSPQRYSTPNSPSSA